MPCLGGNVPGAGFLFGGLGLGLLVIPCRHVSSHRITSYPPHRILPGDIFGSFFSFLPGWSGIGLAWVGGMGCPLLAC